MIKFRRSRSYKAETSGRLGNVQLCRLILGIFWNIFSWMRPEIFPSPIGRRVSIVVVATRKDTVGVNSWHLSSMFATSKLFRQMFPPPSLRIYSFSLKSKTTSSQRKKKKQFCISIPFLQRHTPKNGGMGPQPLWYVCLGGELSSLACNFSYAALVQALIVARTLTCTHRTIVPRKCQYFWVIKLLDRWPRTDFFLHAAFLLS